MRKEYLVALAALSALATLSLPTPARAAPTQCPEHFLGGLAPDILNPATANGALSLCNSGYSVIYSPISMGPLASAEHLTPARISAARGLRRSDSFHAEARLPPAMQMQLGDWRTPGRCIDRGHMANNGDMPDENSAYESFSLANMIPQDTDNNERLWEGIESAVRDITMQNGDVFVVTGPIFDKGASLQRINGKILVPTRLFKAFYIQATGVTGVYLANNSVGEQFTSISVNQLRDISGIDVFPALPQASKSGVAQLPMPRSHFHTNREVKGECTPLAVSEVSGNPAQQAAGQPRSESGGGDRGTMSMLRNIFR